jgi:general secretion pathway protein F
MQRFAYKVYDNSGRLLDGEVTATDRVGALVWLRNRNLTPIEIREGSHDEITKWWNREVLNARKLPRQELALLIREFSTLLAADIPIDQALNIVAIQPMLSQRVRRLVRDIHKRVIEGDPLSQALAAQGSKFPDYVHRLVRAGETSGALSETLEDLAKFLEASSEARSRIYSAFLYPAVLLIATGISIAVIMTILIPTIAPLLRDAGAELPVVLSALEHAHAFLSMHGGLLGLVLGVIVLMSVIAYKNSLRAKRILSGLVLKFPLVGNVVQQNEIARFSRTLGILCRNDVPLLDALATARCTMSNLVLRDVLTAVETEVRQGKTLDAALTATGSIPELALRLVRIGEQTSQLPRMLARVADIYQSAVERRLDRFATLISPILTIVIGVGIGGLVISIMTALVGLNDLALR